MARNRLGMAFTLLTGAAAGFLAAVLLQGAPPAPGRPAEPARATPPVRVGPAQVAHAREPVNPDRDPTTLADILRLDSDFQQTAALYELISHIDADGLEALIDEADSVSGASDRRAALSILFGRYADLDPHRALEFLQARGGTYDQVEIQALFHGWARRDLETAVEAAAALTPEQRSVAGATILLAREDLAAAARQDIARRLQIENVLPQIGLRTTLDQVDRDPVAAWQQALADGDGTVRRQQRLSAIVISWAREDALAAMEAVTSLPNPALRAQLQGLLVQQWSQRDPQAALNWALNQPPSMQRTQSVSIALSSLAGSDPRTAFDIARSLVGEERADATRMVLTRWANDDPVAAAHAIDMVEEPGIRLQAVLNVATRYARHDPRAALQWVTGLAPEDGRAAVSLVFHQLARQDPQQASHDVDGLVDDALRTRAAGAVAAEWTQQDPLAAARWAESLVDEPVRKQAMNDVMQTWAQYDRDGALRHARGIADAADRDAALVAIMQSSHDDTSFNARVFDSLTDPEQRHIAARLLFFNLIKSDPASAERYRDAAGIPEQFLETPQ